MRVIQLISAFHLGGAETAAVHLSIGLAARGHSVTVASVRRPSVMDAVGDGIKVRLSEAGVQVREFAVGNRVIDALMCPIRLASLSQTWHADLIHTHTDVPDLTASIASRLATNLKIARTIHNTELWSTHYRLGRFTESGLRDDMVIYTNADTHDAYLSLRRRYSLVPSPMQTLIKYGFPVTETDPHYDRSYLVQRYGADPTRLQFIFAGRLTHQKGVDILMKAIGSLPPRYISKLQLHVFGDGDQREIVSESARAMTLSVLLHPPEDSLHRLFPAFDCTILTSRHEGLPMVAIESLCQGVPIIVTSAPGLRETVPDWWPLVAPSEDWHAVGDVIRSCIDGAVDLVALGRRGREWASRQYGLTRVVLQHEKAYRELLASNTSMARRGAGIGGKRI